MVLIKVSRSFKNQKFWYDFLVFILNLQLITNLYMKQFLSEKNIVVILFVMVLITFSLAQEDSKKMERIYSGATTATATSFLKQHQTETIDSSATIPVSITNVQ